jgi:two-component system response regulator GlrR
VRPTDSTTARPLLARLISSSNQNLNEQLGAGRLREELFYRLSAVQLRLPALRERREDIPLLVEHFLEQSSRDEGSERKVFAPEAVELLVANNWPGNVRQLRNAVRQNAALSPTRVISPEQVRTALGQEAKELPSFSEARDEFTRNYLVQLLQITGGNVSQAARLAKRNRTDFYKLLGRHQLVPDHFK